MILMHRYCIGAFQHGEQIFVPGELAVVVPNHGRRPYDRDPAAKNNKNNKKQTKKRGAVNRQWRFAWQRQLRPI